MKKYILFFIVATSSIFLSSYNCSAQYSIIMDFTGANGGNPWGSLFYDGTFLYGMTMFGGASKGNIFKIKPDTSGFENLLNFADTNGSYPTGALISDNTFLYGMTEEGGVYDTYNGGDGTIFKIKPDGSNYVKLMDFNVASTGKWPSGSLLYDGNFLYGMTELGGNNNKGTIFKIKTDGSGYMKLLDFSGSNGGNPWGTLLYDGTFLYGMTQKGGTNGLGTIFKIMPDGSNYVKLLDFAGATNGSNPMGDLFFNGTFLYGMTWDGGTYNYGTIFKIMPDGSNYVKLLDFAGTTNGSYPEFGSLIFNGSFLYGMTAGGGVNSDGTIFKIKPDGSNYVKLLDFEYYASGRDPHGCLISDGSFLYGMTYDGSPHSYGIVFKFALHSGDGILEINKKDSITVYPDPATNNLIIETSQKSEIMILNMEGQIIKRLKIKENKTDIDISDFANGVYIIRAQTDKGITTKKFIKE